MLGAVFISSGARALMYPEPLVPKAKLVTDRVAPILQKVDPRLPTDARRLVQLNAGVQLLCGTLLATGRLTRPAAAVLVGTLIPTTFAGHPFWTEEDPDVRRSHRTHFLKNLGLAGGLLIAAADTAGRPGLRWRAGHLLDHAERSVQRTVREARREAKVARRAARVARGCR